MTEAPINWPERVSRARGRQRYFLSVADSYSNPDDFALYARSLDVERMIAFEQRNRAMHALGMEIDREITEETAAAVIGAWQYVNETTSRPLRLFTAFTASVSSSLFWRWRGWDTSSLVNYAKTEVGVGFEKDQLSLGAANLSALTLAGVWTAFGDSGVAGVAARDNWLSCNLRFDGLENLPDYLLWNARSARRSVLPLWVTGIRRQPPRGLLYPDEPPPGRLGTDWSNYPELRSPQEFKKALNRLVDFLSRLTAPDGAAVLAATDDLTRAVNTARQTMTAEERARTAALLDSVREPPTAVQSREFVPNLSTWENAYKLEAPKEWGAFLVEKAEPKNPPQPAPGSPAMDREKYEEELAKPARKRYSNKIRTFGEGVRLGFELFPERGWLTKTLRVLQRARLRETDWRRWLAWLGRAETLALSYLQRRLRDSMVGAPLSAWTPDYVLGNVPRAAVTENRAQATATAALIGYVSAPQEAALVERVRFLGDGGWGKTPDIDVVFVGGYVVSRLFARVPGRALRPNPALVASAGGSGLDSSKVPLDSLPSSWKLRAHPGLAGVSASAWFYDWPGRWSPRRDLLTFAHRWVRQHMSLTGVAATTTLLEAFFRDLKTPRSAVQGTSREQARAKMLAALTADTPAALADDTWYQSPWPNEGDDVVLSAALGVDATALRWHEASAVQRRWFEKIEDALKDVVLHWIRLPSAIHKLRSTASAPEIQKEVELMSVVLSTTSMYPFVTDYLADVAAVALRKLGVRPTPAPIGVYQLRKELGNWLPPGRPNQILSFAAQTVATLWTLRRASFAEDIQVVQPFLWTEIATAWASNGEEGLRGALFPQPAGKPATPKDFYSGRLAQELDLFERTALSYDWYASDRRYFRRLWNNSDTVFNASSTGGTPAQQLDWPYTGIVVLLHETTGVVSSGTTNYGFNETFATTDAEYAQYNDLLAKLGSAQLTGPNAYTIFLQLAQPPDPPHPHAGAVRGYSLRPSPCLWMYAQTAHANKLRKAVRDTRSALDELRAALSKSRTSPAALEKLREDVARFKQSPAAPLPSPPVYEDQIRSILERDNKDEDAFFENLEKALSVARVRPVVKQTLETWVENLTKERYLLSLQYMLEALERYPWGFADGAARMLAGGAFLSSRDAEPPNTAQLESVLNGLVLPQDTNAQDPADEQDESGRVGRWVFSGGQVALTTYGTDPQFVLKLFGDWIDATNGKSGSEGVSNAWSAEKNRLKNQAALFFQNNATEWSGAIDPVTGVALLTADQLDSLRVVFEASLAVAAWHAARSVVTDAYLGNLDVAVRQVYRSFSEDVAGRDVHMAMLWSLFLTFSGYLSLEPENPGKSQSFITGKDIRVYRPSQMSWENMQDGFADLFGQDRYASVSTGPLLLFPLLEQVLDDRFENVHDEQVFLTEEAAVANGLSYPAARLRSSSAEEQAEREFWNATRKLCHSIPSAAKVALGVWLSNPKDPTAPGAKGMLLELASSSHASVPASYEGVGLAVAAATLRRYPWATSPPLRANPLEPRLDAGWWLSATAFATTSAPQLAGGVVHAALRNRLQQNFYAETVNILSIQDFFEANRPPVSWIAYVSSREAEAPLSGHVEATLPPGGETRSQIVERVFGPVCAPLDRTSRAAFREPNVKSTENATALPPLSDDAMRADAATALLDARVRGAHLRALAYAGVPATNQPAALGLTANQVTQLWLGGTVPAENELYQHATLQLLELKRARWLLPVDDLVDSPNALSGTRTQQQEAEAQAQKWLGLVSRATGSSNDVALRALVDPLTVASAFRLYLEEELSAPWWVVRSATNNALWQVRNARRVLMWQNTLPEVRDNNSTVVPAWAEVTSTSGIGGHELDRMRASSAIACYVIMSRLHERPDNRQLAPSVETLLAKTAPVCYVSARVAVSMALVLGLQSALLEPRIQDQSTPLLRRWLSAAVSAVEDPQVVFAIDTMLDELADAGEAAATEGVTLPLLFRNTAELNEPTLRSAFDLYANDNASSLIAKLVPLLGQVAQSQKTVLKRAYPLALGAVAPPPSPDSDGSLKTAFLAPEPDMHAATHLYPTTDTFAPQSESFKDNVIPWNETYFRRGAAYLVDWGQMDEVCLALLYARAAVRATALVRRRELVTRLELRKALDAAWTAAQELLNMWWLFPDGFGKPFRSAFEAEVESRLITLRAVDPDLWANVCMLWLCLAYWVEWHPGRYSVLYGLLARLSARARAAFDATVSGPSDKFPASLVWDAPSKIWAMFRFNEWVDLGLPSTVLSLRAANDSGDALRSLLGHSSILMRTEYLLSPAFPSLTERWDEWFRFVLPASEYGVPHDSYGWMLDGPEQQLPAHDPGALPDYVLRLRGQAAALVQLQPGQTRSLRLFRKLGLTLRDFEREKRLQEQASQFASQPPDAYVEKRKEKATLAEKIDLVLPPVSWEASVTTVGNDVFEPSFLPTVLLDRYNPKTTSTPSWSDYLFYETRAKPRFNLIDGMTTDETVKRREASKSVKAPVMRSVSLAYPFVTNNVTNNPAYEQLKALLGALDSSLDYREALFPVWVNPASAATPANARPPLPAEKRLTLELALRFLCWSWALEAHQHLGTGLLPPGARLRLRERSFDELFKPEKNSSDDAATQQRKQQSRDQLAMRLVCMKSFFDVVDSTSLGIIMERTSALAYGPDARNVIKEAARLVFRLPKVLFDSAQPNEKSPYLPPFNYSMQFDQLDAINNFKKEALVFFNAKLSSAPQYSVDTLRKKPGTFDEMLVAVMRQASAPYATYV